MEYAVFKTGGKQYRVSPGQQLEVDRLPEAKDKISFEEVLLWVNGENIQIGKPTLAGIKISAKLIEQKKGKKLRVSKFKAKSRYRKTIGFRPHLSVLQIEKIGK